MTTSYYATVQAIDGKLLLGGTQKLTSSRFESVRAVNDWLASITSVQGRNIAKTRVFGSELAPQIFDKEVF